MGGGNTPGGVSPHPQGARLALRLVRQGDGLHYPVGQPLFGDSLPFLLPSVADKSCSELLTLRVRVTYMRNALTGHSNAKAGSASSEGSACRFTTWSRKGVVGNLGHVSRPGSQDNMRVDRPEHKAFFAYRKRLEVPDPFDGSERGQERCLKRQELQLDWVQRLKGAPLKSSQDDREVPRGHKGRSWRDSSSWPPSGTSRWDHASQGPAVHCIVVSRNSGYIHFQGGGWQPTLQPFLQERNYYSNRASSGVFSARRTPSREQTPFQCVGLPCWRSPSLNDGLYHRRWKTTQVCRVPSRSHIWRFHRSGRGCHMVPSPWERRSFLRGMRQGGAVAREISSGNQVRVGQWGATSRTCSLSSLSLHSVTGSLGETHTCVRPEASCVPVRLCRGGPRSGRSTAGSGRTRGRQTGSTWASPNRLQISRIVSGWSRHSPGNVSCRESASAARLSCPGMWTARSDLNCVWLQRRRWRASCDMRCDRIPPSRLIYETAAVLSVRTSTCLPNSSGRNCRKAKCTAHSSRQLMCQSSRGPVQSPEAACPLHVAPQSVWQQYAGTLVLGAPRPVERQGLSRGWGSGNTAGRYLLAVYRGAMPTSGPGSVASAEVVSYEAIRAAWLQLWMPYAPGASETVSVVPHSCPLKELRQFSTAWARSSREACRHTHRVELHTEKRDSLHRGELALFPVDPKPQPGWGAGAPSPCDRPTALWIGLE